MSSHGQPPMLLPPQSLPLPSPTPPPAPDYDLRIPQGPALREYLHILLKRRWWVIGTFLSIVLATTLYTLIRTPVYQATATLQITRDNPGSQVAVDDKLSKLSGNDSLEKFQQTQYKILQGPSLAQRVIKALNLAEHPDFKFIREENPEKSADEIENEMIARFQEKLEVAPIRNSYLLEVSFQSPDRQMAQRVVNAIADEYMYLSIDRRNESFALVRRWLDKHLQEMAVKVQEAQKRLYKFGQKTDIFTLEDKDNVIVQKFIDLSSLLTKAQAEKMAKEAQYRQIQEKGPNAPLIVNNPLVAALREKLVAQQAKVSALRRVFRRGHPDLQAEQANLAEWRNRLDAEIQRLQESVEADYEAANRTENLLKESFSAQKEQMTRLQDNLTEFQILKRDAQTNEQLYQALLARVKEANIASTMVPSNVAVINPARLPSKPFKPRTKRDLATALALGLMFGIGAALLVDRLDDSIQSVDDLERSCNLTSLGVVPLLSSNGNLTLRRGGNGTAWGIWRYLPRPQRHRQAHAEAADLDLIVHQAPTSLVTEAIRHTHTSIMLSASGQAPGAIMVTSPNPNEGKTMITSNLSASFALNGRQTVLIDCDLRKPRVHRIFQIQAQPGLTNYLTGNATLAEILQSTPIANLTVITSGARPPSPINLLNSEVFKDLMTHLRQQFHHIIIDTPPILGFADARIISVLVDGVLLVTKYHSTPKSAGRLAYQLLSQVHAPVMGAVLNSIGAYGHAFGDYYYHHHYKYYSKYYGESPE